MILFSLVYISVFSAYYLTTSFLNILYPDTAFISFAIFYGTYAVGSVVSVFLLKLNFKLLLFISCLTFCAFVGFSGSINIPLLLVGSCVAGFGNSIIWLIQGVFLESKETANFFTLFNINIVLGNVFGLIILLSGLSPQIMILSVLALPCIGLILSLFLKVKKREEKESTSLKQILLSFPEIYLLVPSYIYQAIGLNVTYQVVPKLVKDPIYNTIIFIVYGLFAIAFSWLSGKIFIKDWRYVVFGYSTLEIISLVLILTFRNLHLGYWIIIGALRGIIDYSLNNVINISLSLKSGDTSCFFSLYRLIYAVAYLLCSICVGYIPYEYILCICFLFLIFSTLTYILFQKREFNVQIDNISKEFDLSAIQIS